MAGEFQAWVLPPIAQGTSPELLESPGSCVPPDAWQVLSELTVFETTWGATRGTQVHF